MNPITIKHRDRWSEPAETYMLDREQVKLIVFHGTMFFDDDMDVYGIVMSDGTTYWIRSHLLVGDDYAVLSCWLRGYFLVIPVLNEDESPTVVWPAEHAGMLFFEQSLVGTLIWGGWGFPGCYERRKVAMEVQRIISAK